MLHEILDILSVTWPYIVKFTNYTILGRSYPMRIYFEGREYRLEN